MAEKLFTLLIVVLLNILPNYSINAQRNFEQKFYASPEISVGYTLGAKINFGFTLDLGYKDFKLENLKYGTSLSYHLIRVNDKFHRQSTLSLMVENAIVDLKLGIGRMRHYAGYNNSLRCFVDGIAMKFNIKHPNIYSPKIGYRTFIYNKRDWAYFYRNYHSLYIGYGYMPSNNL